MNNRPGQYRAAKHEAHYRPTGMNIKFHNVLAWAMSPIHKLSTLHRSSPLGGWFNPEYHHELWLQDYFFNFSSFNGLIYCYERDRIH